MAENIKIILFLFLNCVIINISSGNCPEKCICDIWNSLKRTSCVGKKLISIDNFIPRKTEALDLSNNVINTVPDYGFQDLEYLKFINLSSNHMGYLSLRSFDGLHNLTTLDLSYNNLQGIIPDMFKTNIHLKTLILTGNQFFIIDTYPFLISNSIQVLMLNKCLISYIYEENLQELKNLTSLDLSDNLLTSFKATNIYENTKLQYLNIKNNDLKCKENQMLNFLIHCFVYKIDCKTDCSIERSQKMMMNEPKTTTTATEPTYTPWDVNDFDEEITTKRTGLQNKMNEINKTYSTDDGKCEVILPIIYAFFSGLAVGMINIGLCVCVCISARNNKKRKREQLIQDADVRWSLNSNIPHIRFTNNT